jgi:hypothetical protein
VLLFSVVGLEIASSGEKVACLVVVGRHYRGADDRLSHLQSSNRADAPAHEYGSGEPLYSAVFSEIFHAWRFGHGMNLQQPPHKPRLNGRVLELGVTQGLVRDNPGTGATPRDSLQTAYALVRLHGGTKCQSLSEAAPKHDGVTNRIDKSNGLAYDEACSTNAQSMEKLQHRLDLTWHAVS